MILVILTPNTKKIYFGGWCGKKNTRVVFAVPDTSDVLEWKKAFKKRSKPFGSVLELKKAFWSGNSRSGVLFLLNLAKFICIYIINKCIYIYTIIFHYIRIAFHFWRISVPKRQKSLRIARVSWEVPWGFCGFHQPNEVAVQWLARLWH